MNIKTSSLSQTLESVNETFFFNRPLPDSEREALALWIARRQGKPNAYADMFAPTPADIRDGLRLFTGETIHSPASLRHVAGEESCRALVLLNSPSPEVRDALQRATDGIRSRLDSCAPNKHGLFCCGTCDPALWRHFATGNFPEAERWLHAGLRALHDHRIVSDTIDRAPLKCNANIADRRSLTPWRRFPLFYTLLALSELDHPLATREIRYVAPALERYLARARSRASLPPTIARRVAVVERALSRI